MRFKQKMMRGAALLTGLVMTAGIAACTQGGGTSSSGTLTVWSVFYDATTADSAMWASAEEAFHEKYPDIKLRVSDHKLNADCYNDLAYYNAINKLPDIVNMEMYTQAMVDMGYLIPIDEYLTDEYKAGFIDGLWDGVTFNGSTYGVPVRMSTMGLMCNMTLLRKCAEYDHNELDGKYTSDWFEGDDWENGAFLNPATPDELKDMCADYKAVYLETNWTAREKAANRDDLYGDSTEGAAIMINCVESGESSAFRALAYMAMFGGNFRDENGDVLLSTEANIKGMEFWQELVESEYTYGYNATSEDGVNSYFMAESTATPFMIDIPALFANYAGGAVLTFDFEYFPLPQEEGVSQSVLCGSIYMGITRSCSNPEAAAYFIKCLTSAEYQTDMYNRSTYRLPVTKEATELVLADADGTYAERNAKMEALLKAYSEAQSFVFGLPGFSTNYTDIWAKWVACLNSIYSGTSVSSALGTFDTAIRQYL